MNKRERHKMYKAALERLDRMGTTVAYVVAFHEATQLGYHARTFKISPK